MSYKYFIIGLMCAGLCFEGHAQTTLSGDHVITGNVDVGTTADKGNLQVTGQTGSSASPNVKVTGDGGVVFEGTYGTGQIPATGAGTRFMWYPKKSAIRAGAASGTEWNDSNVGDYSVAFGLGSLASGSNSTGLSGGIAQGESSVGINGSAYGALSVAMGGGIANGVQATAISSATAFANFSTAISAGLAFGESSTAIGWGFTSGKYSTAIGPGTYAGAYGSCIVGQYNAPNYSENGSSAQSSDALFVVGNGTGTANTDPPEVQYSNALVVYRNGNIAIPKRQGDILMGEFGNP